ncbi:MAG: exodeoxyribonuclease VII large subunit [Oscillospiraceae bacterium]
METPYTYTVSALNRYIKDVVSSDINLRAITIKGEISNFTNHIKTGHFYFTLKDNTASIKAIMFKGNASKVKFDVKNGMNVVICGGIQVFERDGVYQLYCDTLEPDGIGALYLAFEQLKEKLSKLHMFDEEHKKPIPTMPKKIGIVTSKTGAALQDILNILDRRYPLCSVLLLSTLVQGENAPESIVNSIKQAELIDDIDLLIVGRGGGSIEDLWAFNDERVAYAIYNCKIPVISAVGHEIDFTIADFVADLRAPTPSAAAELAVPNITAIYDKIEHFEYLINGYTMSRIKSSYDRLKSDYERLNSLSPMNKVKTTENELNAKLLRLNIAVNTAIETKSQRYAKAVATLHALSPLKVLTRGYSITFADEKVITSVSNIALGDVVKTVLSDGEIISSITKINQKVGK